MRQGVKYLLTAGSAAALFVSASHVLAQQPRVEDLTAPNSFYDRTATREEASGSLALFNATQSNQETIRELRGQIEKLTHELGQLRQQGQQQYMDLDNRLANLEQSGRTPASGGSSEPEDAAEPVSSSGAANASSGSSSDNSDSARRAYKAAFAKVQEREFDAAIHAFESFVSDYPDEGLVANGYYWLGELYSAQSDSEKAGQSFQRVIDDFPDSGKVPDAIYKLALLKAREGDIQSSDALLKRVRNDYPQSSAAELAKDFMRDSNQ